MTSEHTPAPEPEVELTIRVSRAGGTWQARVQRHDLPGTVVFSSAEDLATYLAHCRRPGLR